MQNNKFDYFRKTQDFTNEFRTALDPLNLPNSDPRDLQISIDYLEKRADELVTEFATSKVEAGQSYCHTPTGKMLGTLVASLSMATI